jgi:hypothetical protein
MLAPRCEFSAGACARPPNLNHGENIANDDS